MRLIAVLLLALNALAAGAQRIVSTDPSITETLFAMGLGPRVVGDTIFCNYPVEASRLPRIGTLLKPDVEAIIALRPDLVVVLKRPNQLPEQLTRFRVPFIEVENHTLDDLYAAARAMGKAAGAIQAAEDLVNSMQSQLLDIRKKTADKPKPTVAFIVGHVAGTLEGLVAGSGSSYFSDLLSYAGGTNIFAAVTVPYPKISLEEILTRNPDVILELSGDSAAKQQNVLSLWQRERTLKAVASGRVYAMESSPFEIPGPRAVDAAKTVMRLLHPEIKP